MQRGGGGLARRALTAVRSDPGLCAGAADPAAGAGAACRPAAAVVRHRLVVQSPLPDGYHARALRPRVRRELASTSRTRCSMPRSPRLIDVVLGAAIAYLVLRTQTARPQHALDWTASAALAVPGIVLGIGYLRAFYGVQAVGRHAARLALDHDRAGARDPPPALRVARLLRGAAADLGIAGGSRRKSRRHQGRAPCAAS